MAGANDYNGSRRGGLGSVRCKKTNTIKVTRAEL
jgi:hypothetical protein